MSMENLKTLPTCSGPNPTLNTAISFKVPLPLDPLYAPKLNCIVYD